MLMSTEILVALIGLGGSAIGSLVGIFANSKLIDYRLGAIERKLDEHNTLVDRMYKAEKRIEVLDIRVDELEKNKY